MTNELDQRVEGKIDTILTQLTTISAHLATLNGSVARNTKDIGDLMMRWQKLQCNEHDTEIKLLRREDEVHRVGLTKNETNWERVITIFLGAVQAVITAYLLYVVSAGKF